MVGIITYIDSLPFVFSCCSFCLDLIVKKKGDKKFVSWKRPNQLVRLDSMAKTYASEMTVDKMQ